jgi:serine/threonine-protein kinase HipA
MTVLDRLAYVGSNGMGALIFRPEMEVEKLNTFKLELDEITKASKLVINGTATKALDKLHQLAGSSGGARPKILVAYNAATDHLMPTEKKTKAELHTLANQISISF